MSNAIRSDFYNRICRTLTDYEEFKANSSDLYDLLCDLQNSWDHLFENLDNPDSKPRPLTKEELIRSNDAYIVVEYRWNGEMEIFYKDSISDDNEWILWTNGDYFSLDNYLRSYRCWNVIPTKAERVAAEWRVEV